MTVATLESLAVDALCEPDPPPLPGDFEYRTPLELVADFLAAKDGRRFVPEDVDLALYNAASAYAAEYTGTFQFMVEMRAEARTPRGLRVGQAKGVLNCMRAEVERQARQAAVAAQRETVVAAGGDPDNLGPAPLQPGLYIVTFPNGEQARVRVKPLDAPHAQRYGVAPGTLNVGFYSYGDTDTSYTWTGLVTDNVIVRRWRLRLDEVPAEYRARVRANAARLEPALRVLAASPEGQVAAGKAFAEAAGACYKCGKALVDDLSRQRSVGPDCWQKYGMGAAQAA